MPSIKNETRTLAEILKGEFYPGQAQDIETAEKARLTEVQKYIVCSDHVAEQLLDSGLVLKFILSGVDAKPVDDHKVCECENQISFIRIDFPFGSGDVLPRTCNDCRIKAYKEYQQKEIVEAWQRGKAKCCGFQNQFQIHEGVAPTAENLKHLNHQEKALEYIVAANRGDESIGAFFWGGVGGGKTYLAKVLHNALLRKHENSCFIKAVKLVQVLRNTSLWKTSDVSHSQVIKEFENVKYLFIDDYGTQKDTEFVRENLFSILDARYENRRFTLITSNYDTEDLSEKGDTRLVSRMCDERWMRSFHFKSEDLRKRNQYS